MSRWVYGAHPVREALKSLPDGISHIELRKGKANSSISEIASMAIEAGIEIREVSRKRLDGISRGGNHQGVVAMLSEFEYADFDRWLESIAGNDEKPVILALDHVQDPHNLGSLLRSAECLAAGMLLITKDGCSPVTDTVIRVSSGAADLVPVCRVTNLVRALEKLKKAGYWVVGTSPEADVSIYEADLNMALVAVLGSEGSGLRRLVKKTCDLMVSLPRLGRVQSMNVSVSGGILLAEIHRQKR